MMLMRIFGVSGASEAHDADQQRGRWRRP